MHNADNMRYMKIALGTVAMAVCLGAASAMASPVDSATAERVARHFWNSHRDQGVPALSVAMRTAVLPWDAFYVFESDEAAGFVIVAADDCIEPVLAYSFSNGAVRGDSVGREMRWWLDGWQQQVDAARSAGLKPTAAVSARWQTLAEGTAEPLPLTVTAPMLTTQWDQDAPYNDKCPSRTVWGYTSRAATGCVATAMAQVMRYWSYPQQGIGINTYNSTSPSGWGQGFGKQTVDFGATTYQWDSMPDVLTSVSGAAQIDAVATLMYHCGVACEMMYGTAFEGGSGAFVHSIPLLSYGHALNGMIEFFGYSSAATGVDRVKYDDSTWTAMVRGELDHQRPIIYAGGDDVSGGHCFVCDGYDAENRFHFNWGWSGTGDGYFLLDHLAPGVGGTGGGTGTYDFTNLQQILVGIQPHQSEADSSCTIRQLPYEQTFETAPAGWRARTSSNYTYSWLVSDTAGCDGNYSLCVSAPLYGASSDTLYFPLIAVRGEVRISWIDRALGSAASYRLVAHDSLLFADSAVADTWNRREVVYTIAEGDSLQLMFMYRGTQNSAGVLIDSILIESTTPPAGIAEAAEVEMHVYPNPTSGVLTIACDGEMHSAELYNAMGQRVMHTGCKTTRLDLSALPGGYYMLRVVTPMGIATEKIMKL